MIFLTIFKTKMIAKIEGRPFSIDVLSRKIDYHKAKTEKGVATFLDSSMGAINLEEFKKDCILIKGLNDRVKYPFNEVSLSFQFNEKLADDKLLSVANEYMNLMGYNNTNFAIIKHSDKSHLHIHILFSTIDKEGKRIKDSNLFYKSQKVSRMIEEQFNLQETIYRKFENKNLHEVNARKYYFDAALKKALSIVSLKEKIYPILEKSLYVKLSPNKTYPNMFYEKILDQDYYNQIGEILTENNLLKPYYKEELIKKLEESLKQSSTIAEFRNQLALKGGYMRMVTVQGKSSYIYGLVDASIYFKEKSLPQKFRFNGLKLKQDNNLSIEEQKSAIYTTAYNCLAHSHQYSDFIKMMKSNRIDVMEARNARGVYGLSFSLVDVPNAHIFKASDVSRNFSYGALQKHFELKAFNPDFNTPKNIYTSKVFNFDQERQPSETFISFLPMNYSEEDDSSDKRKKKKNNRQTYRNNGGMEM